MKDNLKNQELIKEIELFIKEKERIEIEASTAIKELRTKLFHKKAQINALIKSIEERNFSEDRIQFAKENAIKILNNLEKNTEKKINNIMQISVKRLIYLNSKIGQLQDSQLVNGADCKKLGTIVKIANCVKNSFIKIANWSKNLLLGGQKIKMLEAKNGEYAISDIKK